MVEYYRMCFFLFSTADNKLKKKYVNFHLKIIDSEFILIHACFIIYLSTHLFIEFYKFS